MVWYGKKMVVGVVILINKAPQPGIGIWDLGFWDLVWLGLGVAKNTHLNKVQSIREVFEEVYKDFWYCILRNNSF